jgi:hypothetical protein
MESRQLIYIGLGFIVPNIQNIWRTAICLPSWTSIIRILLGTENPITFRRLSVSRFTSRCVIFLPWLRFWSAEDSKTLGCCIRTTRITTLRLHLVVSQWKMTSPWKPPVPDGSNQFITTITFSSLPLQPPTPFVRKYKVFYPSTFVLQYKIF